MLGEGLRERSVAGVDCGTPGKTSWRRLLERERAEYKELADKCRVVEDCNPTEVDDKGFVGLSHRGALELLGSLGTAEGERPFQILLRRCQEGCRLRLVVLTS